MRPLLILVLFGIIAPVAGLRAADVDTEHMFGFSEGTDIGVPFQPEGELETIGRAGKASGSYTVLTTTANLKYPLSPQFRIAPGIAFANYSISGVPNLDDSERFSFDHAVLEFRWHPLARESHPVGLTIIATPFFGTMDPITGLSADNYGAQFISAIDRALLPDRLFAAINFAYTLNRTRPWASGVTTDASVLVPSIAASARLSSWLYVGTEVRYLLGFDGLALQALSDQALYVGPTFYVPLVGGASLSGAWEPQLWGRAGSYGTGLDVVQFERQQFKLRLAIDL